MLSMALALAFGGGRPGAAQDLIDLLGEGGPAKPAGKAGKKGAARPVAEDLFEKQDQDVKHMGRTHISLVRFWEGVRPADAAAATNEPYAWREDKDGLAVPVRAGAPIGTLIAVPAEGTYRISLRQRMAVGRSLPVTLTLTPQKITAGDWPPPGPGPATNPVVGEADGPALEHVFGSGRLPAGQTGLQVEKERPIRIETETDRIATLPKELIAWEYWDAPLQKGVYRATLAADDVEVRVHTLAVSASKDFRPNWSTFDKDRPLGRIFVRFRPGPGSAGRGTISVDARLGYHWGGRNAPNSTQPAWSWPVGKTAPVPPGQWSAFLDATDAIVPGAGPWSTFNMSVAGHANGPMEAQLAWFPDEAAVVKTVTTVLDENGRGWFRVPHKDWTIRASAGVPAWGVWGARVFDTVRTQEEVVERYFAWAQAAEKALALAPDHPRVRHIRVYTGCSALSPVRERVADMLAQLGYNWIDSAPESVVRRYGLYDDEALFNATDYEDHARRRTEEQRKKVAFVKNGDEISTLADIAMINQDEALMAGFRDYLREQAVLEGAAPEGFYGVRNLEDLECLADLPALAGRYERRVYYHSQRYAHLVTADRYARYARGFEKYFPNIRVCNNYSPHPPFLNGTTMNHSDWFVLPRRRAQTLAWAEDWATSGSWGLGTAFQCTSFYAAIVECSARKHGLPSGLYIVVSCGGAAVKAFACLAAGHTWLYLYTFGPIDNIAEGSNSWSEHEYGYHQVRRATAALGPVDEIVAKGVRERRRTAILYNRSHEIMTGGTGRLNHDWMWTFIGLKASQIPVEVIIEEDLNPEDLARYDCVYVGGFNLAGRHVQALRDWVEQGGLLIGTAGAARHDLYGDPQPAADTLFGARQAPAEASQTAAVARVVFQASDWFPAADLATHGLTYVLTPTTGKPLAAYGDGRVAAVVNPIGKGHAILLGILPGYVYRQNGKALAPVREWLAAPALKRLGRQRVEFDYPASEATLFEHESGLAVLLADFGKASPAEGSRLSVQTDRDVKEVRSALRGPLEWKRVGGRIEVKTPHLDPVDAILFR
jgi:hypothetical protein